ncbi:MAG: hypothetical protein OJJ21_13250 [Ferrovibrio sp.]|uniref:hypothetical protein n=1 Tax=Ferrovibrio sp. TaxID=1917215 RepID=UPI0026366D32|nr:hypothetical protein [Ferrovibrio sp.]MCW0234561.1 hypothetical protein [Ferrovibrio sp.]
MLDLLPAMLILVAWSFGSIMSYSGLLPSIAAVSFDAPKYDLVFGRNLIFVGIGVLLACLIMAHLVYWWGVA